MTPRTDLEVGDVLVFGDKRAVIFTSHGGVDLGIAEVRDGQVVGLFVVVSRLLLLALAELDESAPMFDGYEGECPCGGDHSETLGGEPL